MVLRTDSFLVDGASELARGELEASSYTQAYTVSLSYRVVPASAFWCCPFTLTLLSQQT
jgi:hypothetical protein